MKIERIDTERLTLIPITYDITKALAIGNFNEIENIGLKTNGNWPRQDTMDILPFVNKAFEQNSESTGFEFWMIVNKADRTIIGDIGFKGIPDGDGVVEIGYGLIDQEQQKGYGFEALKAMLAWAFSVDQVKIVKADCLISNAPSIRILQKAGMIEMSRDHEMIYWEMKKG